MHLRRQAYRPQRKTGKVARLRTGGHGWQLHRHPAPNAAPVLHRRIPRNGTERCDRIRARNNSLSQLLLGSLDGCPEGIHQGVAPPRHKGCGAADSSALQKGGMHANPPVPTGLQQNVSVTENVGAFPKFLGQRIAIQQRCLQE